jgi:two-component system OmpR family sensor kinase
MSPQTAPQQTAPQQSAQQQSAAHAEPSASPAPAQPVVTGSAARQRIASHPVPPRRWSLRARLIALVVATAAVALVAVDIVLPLLVRDAAIATKDATLTGVITAAKTDSRLTARMLSDLSSLAQLRGEIGWSSVSSAGISLVEVPTVSDGDANPDLTDTSWLTGPATVVDSSNGDQRYRAQGFPISIGNDPGYLVAWMPLNDVDATFRRLILIELLVTAGLLVLLGSTASLVIRRELKPLESMATAADDIAQGDLKRRVDESDPSTEIGRLGVAFNDMLDGISTLLDERRRSEQRLRQFVADASHELRTPVAAVRGYTDLYNAGALPDDAAVERAMRRMGFEARRMGALVDDLLTLIQADAERTMTHERVDLTDLLTGVVDDAAVIDPTRTWRLSGGYGPAIAVGDRLRLHQLFANLLANVRTHTQPGTVATVSVLPGLDEIAVTVSDNGPGVSDEALQRLFDRFYRVDPSRSRENGGTGLGLSIVAAIVRSHGGQILASHTPGGGLTMTVVLPRATGTAAVPPPTAQSGPAGLTDFTGPKGGDSAVSAAATTGPLPYPPDTSGAAGTPGISGDISAT